MHIVHPVYAVIPSEVNDFAVNEAASSRDADAWLVTAHDRFYPSQSLGVEVEDVVQLSQLVRLAAEDVDPFVERDC